GGVAAAGAVAGVLGGADDRIGADAEARRTGVGLRAAIAVGARRPVRLRRWLTPVSRLVACPVVALVPEEGAIAGGAPAHACAAGVAHGAEEPIIAGHAIGFARVGADAGDGVAAARLVALIGGGADDGVRPDAGAGLAGVGLGARIAGGAGAAVRLGRGGADAVRRIAGARVVALCGGGADDGVRPDAGAGLAGVDLGAGIAVGAGAAVRLGRVGAGAVGRIAGARVVALIEGGADDRVCPDAGAGLAGVGLGAGIAVGAGAAVRLGRGGAGAVGRITSTGDVTLIEGGADDRVRPDAGAGLAGVDLGAGIAVGAGAAVRLGRRGAGAVGRIAGAGDVALIEGGADDGVRPDAAAGLAGVALGAGVAV